MNPGHEFPVGGGAKVEWCSPAGGKEVVHVLARSLVLPVCPGLNVRSTELPCLDPFWAEDVSVDLYELVPLVIGSLPVEGVCQCAMIEARNGFRERSASGVGSSGSLSFLIGLVGAVTGIGLVQPLSEWDRRDSVPSHGREGYCVSPKSGKRVVDVVGRRVVSRPSPWDGQCLPGEVGWRGVNLFWLEVIVVEDGNREVPFDLGESSLSISWGPRPRGIVGVVIGANMRSITPWVCCLGTPYVPCRGAWVLRFGCRGSSSVTP